MAAVRPCAAKVRRCRIPAAPLAAGDPQLHTHVVVANLTHAGGKFTALDAHALYQHKSAAGAVYRAALRAEVRELPWVAWERVSRGLFEIDGMHDALRHFSQRRAEIEERAAELVGAGHVGSLSRERMQGIALATRRPKQHDAVHGQLWRDDARPRSAEHGFGPAELAALRSRSVRDQGRPSLRGLVARLSGPDGLTATHNSFVRRHALAENAGPALRQVIRQHNPAERDALAALHNGNRRPLPRAQGRGHHDPRHRERRNRRRDRRPGRHSHRARSHRRRDDRP